MKKFLLLSVAVLVAICGTAKRNHVVPMSNPLDIKLPKMVNNGAFKSVASKMAAYDAFYSGVEKSTRPVLKAVKKAADVELVPAYALADYTYTELTGLTSMPMYDGASFLVKEGKAYLAPFENAEYFEGVIEQGDNMYKEDGADSITFTVVSPTPAAVDNEDNQYFMGLATLNPQTGALKRNDQTTIGAYYFAEADELYVPVMSLSDFVCLFMEDDKTPLDGFVLANFDLQSQESLKEYMSKGTFTGTEPASGSYPAEDYSGDIVALVSDYIYVKGFNPIGAIKDSWVEFEVSDEGDMATVSDAQLLGMADFYADEAQTSTVTVAFCPVGILPDFSAYTDDYSSSYFIVDDETEETTTIESTGMDCYGIYGYSKSEDWAGAWSMLQDLKIVITYEPVEDAIRNTTVKTASTDYFDMQGRKVNAAQKGLLIKKSTMADGSVQSVKVLNK
ncbi:MAG: hypothetical protein K6G08_03695 [Prevotella sp.]|nr:hypothetical protein [Prevotella sp.]